MRSPSIDVLRIVTVALIVWRHTFGASDLMIASVGVPFFFFLTGWLWRPGRRTLRQEITHRWGTLGVPYLAWLVLGLLTLVAVYAFRGQLTSGLIVNPLLGGSFARAPFSTLWFVTALFGVAVIMRIIERRTTPGLTFLAVVFLAVGSWWGETLALVPLSLGIMVPCVGFALSGRLLYVVSQYRAGRMIAVVLLPVACFATIWCERLRLKIGDFGTPMVSALCAIVVTWGAIVFLDWVSDRAPVLSVRLSSWLWPVTSVAIVVVLTHPFVLWAGRLVRPEPLGTVGLFLAALIIPWLVGLGLQRSQLAPLLIGESWLRSIPVRVWPGRQLLRYNSKR